MICKYAFYFPNHANFLTQLMACSHYTFAQRKYFVDANAKPVNTLTDLRGRARYGPFSPISRDFLGRILGKNKVNAAVENPRIPSLWTQC